MWSSRCLAVGTLNNILCCVCGSHPRSSFERKSRLHFGELSLHARSTNRRQASLQLCTRRQLWWNTLWVEGCVGGRARARGCVCTYVCVRVRACVHIRQSAFQTLKIAVGIIISKNGHNNRRCECIYIGTTITGGASIYTLVRSSL